MFFEQFGIRQPSLSGDRVSVNSRRIQISLLLVALTLPIVLAVLLGLARLLEAMQDAAGAALLNRLGLAVAILWVIDLICLVLVGTVNSLSGPGDPPEAR